MIELSDAGTLSSSKRHLGQTRIAEARLALADTQRVAENTEALWSEINPCNGLIR